MQIVRRLSINLSKRVVGGASNSVRGSNIQWRGRSDSAAAVKQKPKRVSKDERKAMVEAFVNKYRAMNDGKFPPTKVAMKEVSGSYYTIKKIVQELQYNSKMRVEHKDTVVKEASAGEAATRKDNLSFKVEETSSRATVIKQGECKDGTSQEAQSLTIGGDINSIREAEAKLQTPIAADQTFLREKSRISGSDNEDVAAPVLEPELKTSSHSEVPENNIKQKISPMENFKFDGLRPMDEQKHSPELEKPTRELSSEHKADTQTESKSSMWKNLKSLADGILNMWRK